MSLTNSPDQSPAARHPIDESIVSDIDDDPEYSVSSQELTESLNLLQALLATNRDVRSFFTSLGRPEQFATIEDGSVYALVTPVTWWELQAYSEWENEIDLAMLEAHRRQFMDTVENPTTRYSAHQLDALHPIVSHVPSVEKSL